MVLGQCYIAAEVAASRPEVTLSEHSVVASDPDGKELGALAARQGSLAESSQVGGPVDRWEPVLV